MQINGNNSINRDTSVRFGMGDIRTMISAGDLCCLVRYTSLCNGRKCIAMVLAKFRKYKESDSYEKLIVVEENTVSRIMGTGGTSPLSQQDKLIFRHATDIRPPCQLLYRVIGEKREPRC